MGGTPQNGICLAVSVDGVNFSKKGRVIEHAYSPYPILYNGKWEMWCNDEGLSQTLHSTSDDGLSWSSPQLAVSKPAGDAYMVSPTVVVANGTYHLWSAATAGGTSRHWTSPDGISWSGGSFCTGSAIIGHTVLYEDSKFKAWGMPGSLGSIAYYESSDGHSWSNLGMCLSGGGDGSWEDSGPTSPTVLHLSAGYYMWYYGIGPDPALGGAERWNIGLATSSNGRNFTRHPDNPVIKHGTNPSDPDYFHAGPPSAVEFAVIPENLRLNDVGQESFMVTWDALSGVSSYRVHVRG